MRAARFHPDEGLEIEELPRPTVGPGEVLVRVEGAGLCHSDPHILDGRLPLAGPTVLGHENAGVVAETGAGVDVEPGTTVAVFGGWGCGSCRVCARGEDQLCDLSNWVGVGHDGGYAEYLQVPAERYVLPIGDLDPVAAAPLTDAALTPYRAVRTAAAELSPADAVVLAGIGGLGHYGVQLARLATGARIVAVDLSSEKLDRASELGADATVNASEEHVPRAVRAAAGDARIGAVVDFVGSDATLQWATNVLGTGGRLVLAGIGEGQVPFSWNPLLGSEVSFHTVQWGSLPELRAVLSLARADRLEIEVETIGFDELSATLDRLDAGEVEGRAVLTP
ncbi:alcohol dehydrogenase [Halobacteriales archaeon QS_4_69_34]|nr:MAG: alcohol dehydrogenase [Halobacteriales archaeon QS_4_69_34]